MVTIIAILVFFQFAARAEFQRLVKKVPMNASERWSKHIENEQVQRIPSRAFTTQKQQYVRYNEANAHEEHVDENQNVKQVAPQNIKNENFAKYENKNIRQDAPYNMKNVKVPEYVNQNVKEEADYENENVKHISSQRNIKKGVRTYLHGGIQNAPAPKDNAKDVQYIEGNTEGAKEYNENKGNNAPEYYEDNAAGSQDTIPAVNIDTFKKIDMIKSNDSYEDYVTPARGNVFASDERMTTTMKPMMGVQRYVAPAQSKYNQNNRPKPVANGYVKKEKIYGSNLKAGYLNKDDVVAPARVLPKGIIPQQIQHSEDKPERKESLWYEDVNFQNYDDSKTTTLAPIGGKFSTKRKILLGTMIPTRFHLKISSPNYIAKLPAVAEKYNFNEPIPEKDRGRENIKHIGNLHALINKKIRI